MAESFPFLGVPESPERFREWWQYACPVFRYLCPAGSFEPFTRVYTSTSAFGRDYAPHIRSITSPFYYQNTAVQLSSRESFGPLGSGFPSVRLRQNPDLFRFEICLHTPANLAHGSFGLTDHFRVPHSLELCPRITVVPRILVSEPEFHPDTGPYRVPTHNLMSAWAIACSMRAQIALFSIPHSFLRWDVGLFQPSQADILRGFGTGTFPSRNLADIRRFDPGNQLFTAPLKSRYWWGAMLLVSPCNTWGDLCSILCATGHPLPLSGGGDMDMYTEKLVVDRFHQSFSESVRRLHNWYYSELAFLTPAFSYSGTRILDASDLPDLIAHEPPDPVVRVYGSLPHPLGIEITLPTDACMPLQHYYEYGLYAFSHFPLDPVLRKTEGTSLAWMADIIELSLMRFGFSTIFRSFHLDDTTFRVRLFVMDQAVHPGDFPTFDACWKSCLLHVGASSSPEPLASNLYHPAGGWLPYLFPCTLCHVSQYAVNSETEPPEIVEHRERYELAYPAILQPFVPTPWDPPS